MHVRLRRTVLLAALTLLISACAGGRPEPPCGDGLCEAGETWDMCQQIAHRPVGTASPRHPRSATGPTWEGPPA